MLLLLHCLLSFSLPPGFILSLCISPPSPPTLLKMARGHPSLLLPQAFFSSLVFPYFHYRQYGSYSTLPLSHLLCFLSAQLQTNSPPLLSIALLTFYLLPDSLHLLLPFLCTFYQCHIWVHVYGNDFLISFLCPQLYHIM